MNCSVLYQTWSETLISNCWPSAGPNCVSYQQEHSCLTLRIMQGSSDEELEVAGPNRAKLRGPHIHPAGQCVFPAPALASCHRPVAESSQVHSPTVWRPRGPVSPTERNQGVNRAALVLRSQGKRTSLTPSSFCLLMAFFHGSCVT